MRKKQIINRMSQIVNKDAESGKRITKNQLEQVVDAFKQVMLECIAQGEDFDYRSFFEVETTIVEPRERRNPKTGEMITKDEGYKAKIRFTHSVKELIKTFKIK